MAAPPVVPTDATPSGDPEAENQAALAAMQAVAATLEERASRAPKEAASVLAAQAMMIQSAGQEPKEPGARFDDGRFGNISRKDRRLLQDALDVGCDAFMTMERRLATAAEFIQRTTRFRVMRPTTYWHLLDPWAALYY
jgi:type IV secretory pathway VirB9-like protein